MVNTSLPPGFRFHPTDVELILYYLKRKVLGKKLLFDAIAEVDVYNYAPWDLPDKSCLKTKDLKWYFFCARAKKYGSGVRIKRATEYGFWKATGKDRPVNYNEKIVGQIKTLVFHQGKPPKGDRTNWVMHEYRLDDKDLLDRGVVQDSYSISVVFQKDGIGPRNGAQYGAPFKEEDWCDIDEPDCGEAVYFAALPTMPTAVPPQINTNPITDVAGPSKSICHAAAPDSCMSDSQISSHDVLPPLPSVSMNSCGVQNDDDDVALLLAQFTEEGDPGVYIKDKAEKQGNASQHNDFTSLSPDFDPDTFFQDLDLPVLANLDAVNHGGSNSSGYERPYLLTDILPYDNSTFMELLDMSRPLNSLPRFSASDQQTHGGCSYANNNDAQPPIYPANRSSADQHTFGLNKSDRW